MQIQIHRLVDRGRFPALVDRFIIGMYSQPPADIPELTKTLDLFGIVGERRATVIKTVQSAFQSN